MESATSVVAEPIRPTKHSYGEILKASVMIGGASVVNVGLGIVRTKTMAVLLGPAGVGLIGLYSSIADLTQSVAGLGINSSGVRQIAEAVGSGDSMRVTRTASVLRRVAALLGIFGAALLLIFSRQVSFLTFGSESRAHSVAILSIAVFLTSISGGQAALLQGLRRISDLARMSMLGAFFGTVISIPLVYWLGQDGVVLSLVGAAATTMGTSWAYSRKVRLQPTSLTGIQIRRETALLVKLGVAFMASGLLTIGTAYVIRLLVVRSLGVEAAGLYQSAWALGGLYIGFILQAMGTDFYPRLTAASGDHAMCNSLVNQQAQISLLLAGPGVLATLTFAPLVLSSFYSSEFAGAVEILRWICLGMTFRVIAWPMGFIVLAKGAQTVFFWTEVAATLVHIGLAWVFLSKFKLAGAGMAFFGLYLWHSFLIYWIAGRMTGFRWSQANSEIAKRFLPLIAFIFIGFYFLPGWLVVSIGSLAVVASAIYSIRMLIDLLPGASVPPFVSRLFRRSTSTPL